MKRLVTGILIIAFGLLFITAGAETPADKISERTHLKEINRLTCKVAVDTKKATDKASCLQRLNSMTEANPANEKNEVSKKQSDKCVNFLKQFKTVDEIMTKSITGPCEMNELQK